MSSLPDLGTDRDEIPCGRYKVASTSPCRPVEASKGFIRSELWFNSGSLPESLIERVSRVQLITESHGQKTTADPSEGNWTWFELGISGSEGSRREERRWMSHENAFLTDTNEWREGRIFGRDHELLKSLRSLQKDKDHDRIEVRSCACFGAWSVHANKGYLVFDIGCGPFTQNPRGLLLGLATYRRIAIAGTGPPADRLLTEHQGSEEVRYIKTVDINDRPSILIYKTTLFPNAENLSSGSGFQLPDDYSRLLVVMDASDLDERYKSHNFSWDQTAEDFWDVGATSRFHLLIRFGDEGAIYKDPKRPGRQVLIFEPQNAQGHFLKSYLNQKGVDQNSIKASLKANLEAAYIAGLAASLAKESTSSLSQLCETQIKEAATTALRWSRRYAATKLGKAQPSLATWHNMKFETEDDPVLIPVRLPHTMEEKSSLVFRTLPHRPIEHAAWDIVRNGLKDVLDFVPTARFKEFVTADRHEVQEFRKIACAIEKYLREDTNVLKPFSIAVFGQPGSGKSFSVKRVIQSIMDDAKQEKTELHFDLSQFQDNSDLQTAFETIRDVFMSGKLPVVFFDEFDTTFNHLPLYWLEHFLGPMREGNWDLGNGASRPLGRGIYVFIGGTAKTFAEFCNPPSVVSPIDSPVVTQPAAQADSSSDAGATKDDSGFQVPRGCEFLKEFLNNQLGDSCWKSFTFKVLPTKGYTDLVKFFYEIRECTNLKVLPIVFFEGFDANLDDLAGSQSECLGWLKYFLAPMQDGKFIDKGHSRPLGRAIFFFVEGNSGLTQEFLDCQNAPVFFREAKGPDFVSRLQGYVSTTDKDTECLKNVVRRYTDGSKSEPLSLGVFRSPGGSRKPAEVQASSQQDNRQIDNSNLDSRRLFARLVRGQSVGIQGPNKVHDKDDMFVIRRAILLRLKLEGSPMNGKIELDDKVLNAMLKVERFHHGARSLEAILLMSKLPSAGERLTRSHLPNDSQLRLHVDPNVFNRFVEENPTVPKRGVEDPKLRLRRAEIAWQKARFRGEIYPKDGDFVIRSGAT